MSFWVKTNRFIKLLFPNYTWDIPNTENKVFLTFDDGPLPEITEWVLEQLRLYNAKATFFCIGNNIEKYPDIFQKIITEDHAIGNHTFNHLKGWKTNNDTYLENIKKCSGIINKFSEGSQQKTKDNHNSELFRPPYGKIKSSQSRILRRMGYRIIMWDVISMDFDQTISEEKCLENVLKNVTSGSVIVFHDSIKAEQNLRYVLPKTLAYLKEKGFVCAKID
ncbi:polysaccharide deacetylase family protein [Flavobacterium silvisoli]|uniref:Polysaccharide deacetylase family protein n=1 Tax=Flavobacterium silvisoli TaxID=2529433 RepID=A0A4Q9Z3Y2_9FLAO|nr:polysaccharide deacetylase family protein [Flavobacterium silvisoli]TBX70962.1 polysaccharide deacetylase family protein [Flavobacterium silvisoli]